MRSIQELAEEFVRRHSRVVRVDELNSGRTEHGYPHKVVLWDCWNGKSGLENLRELLEFVRSPHDPA